MQDVSYFILKFVLDTRGVSLWYFLNLRLTFKHINHLVRSSDTEWVVSLKSIYFTKISLRVRTPKLGSLGSLNNKVCTSSWMMVLEICQCSSVRANIQVCCVFNFEDDPSCEMWQKRRPTIPLNTGLWLLFRVLLHFYKL